MKVHRMNTTPTSEQPKIVTEWEWTEAAVRVIKKCIRMMYENEPDKKDVANRIPWEQEMHELRRWAISVHNRRINVNMKRLRK